MIRFLALGAALLALSCTTPEGEPVRLAVPRGASMSQVTDSLVARSIVGNAKLFRAYVRVRRADRGVKAGTYAFRRGERWGDIVEALRSGRVVSLPMTIPEGWTMDWMVPRMAAATGLPEDTVRARMRADSLAERLSVPGPGLEGYLFPDTYRFTPGTSLTAVLTAMTQRYRQFWTPERRARLEQVDLTEREAVTLASIVQAEARHLDEMPTIAAVYLNRVRKNYPLQADPTVLYALGGPRERLLYAAIDSVADHPYNTYRRAGLPPGPIGAPGEAALEAVLAPAQVDYFYFVAGPDGSHAFTRTLAEHNRAKALARRAWDSAGTGALPRPALDSTAAEPSR
ncbi:MAG: endolytic transglycosylase MltG [Gemmatimonadetes bacterium]|nr:endolytic transglycosylase MltG [Gemmatimonadota bacterium]